MKHIVQFIGALSDGGAETLVRNYALLMNGLRHDGEEIKVTILTIMPVKGTANYSCLKDTDINIISIYKRYNLLSRIHRFCVGKYYVPYCLKRTLMNLKPNVIHVHLQILHYLVPISKALRGVKIVYTCHSEPQYHIGKYHKDENLAVKRLLKSNNLQLVALHDEMRIEINSMFGINNTTVVHNGIDLDRFCNVKESKIEIRRALGISQDAFVVGHVGRFTPPKNHSFIIDIFSEVIVVKPNAFLLLIGSGPLLEKVKDSLQEKKLEGRCKILSHRRDIPQLLKAMDVFLFPSLFEGMPVALIEAQAANTRCVKSTSVTNDSVISPHVQSIPLDSSLTIWRDAVINESNQVNHVNTIELFSDKNMLKELLNIYFGED